MKKGILILLTAILIPLEVIASQLCVGDLIVTDSHRHGQVMAAYVNDDTVDIKFQDGSVDNWPTGRVYKVTDKVRGFNVGDQVVTDSHRHGAILNAYPSDDTVDLKFSDGSVDNWPISRIYKITVRVQGFNVGEQIVTDSHRHGAILNTYSSDSTVDLKFSDGSVDNWPISRVYKVTVSVQGFNVGDQVVTDSHRHGAILNTYSSDSTVDLKFSDGSVDNWPISRLYKVSDCTTQGTCKH